MNNVLEQEEIKIEDMIYEIRGKQVMLDSDLAKLYQCKNGTKEINQAVKNNMDKLYISLYNTIFSPKDVIEILGVSPNTATKYINKFKDNVAILVIT